jgi:integrase-like protein
MHDAWYRTLDRAQVRRIRPYDLRHTFASLMIAAGKNPLYIARQMGHHSAGFTLDTYGHLMDQVQARQVEWIDEIVFPEGFAAALNLHLSGPGLLQGTLRVMSKERAALGPDCAQHVQQAIAGVPGVEPTSRG